MVGIDRLNAPAIDTFSHSSKRSCTMHKVSPSWLGCSTILCSVSRLAGVYSGTCVAGICVGRAWKPAGWGGGGGGSVVQSCGCLCECPCSCSQCQPLPHGVPSPASADRLHLPSPPGCEVPGCKAQRVLSKTNLERCNTGPAGPGSPSVTHQWCIACRGVGRGGLDLGGGGI